MTKRREIGSHKEAIHRMVTGELGGFKEAAHLLGMGKSQVYAMADEDAAAEITFIQAMRLLRAAERPQALVEFVAAVAGCSFAPAHFEDAAIDALLARYSKEHGDVISAALKAMQTQLSRADAATLMRECQEAARVLMHCAHELQRRMG